MKISLLISLFSYLFRTFILSQFFDFGGLILLIDLIAPKVTFLMVGTIYPPGKNPPLGAIMYLIMYVLNYVLGNILINTWFNFMTLISIVIYTFAIGIYYYIFDKILRN
ncbi:MAG: hypothetical protein Q8T08_05250 [Ignavibacteria bacterium]|nr:hypothetical protein [Ignavibacteria bacterium]